MTDRELMRQAVVALDLAMLHGEFPQSAGILRDISNAANALSARLAQPEPEPVAKLFGTLPVYETKQDGILTVNAPPQREWQGLTNEDRQELAAEQYGWEGLCSAVEAKLREKNT
jgi:hypothetical protein